MDAHVNSSFGNSLEPSRDFPQVPPYYDNALTLKVKDSKVPAIIPLSDVNRLEIYRGTRSAAGRGALVGFLALAALSFPAWQGCGSCSGSAPAAFVMVYGALGAGLGAGIGYAIREQRWEGVPATRVQVGVAPLPGRGLAASLSLSWGSRARRTPKTGHHEG